MKGISIFISRLLLVVLIGTFMSPGFAWQMIDSHSESTDSSVVVDAAVHHYHHDGDNDDDDAAHGQIGHLLSHLSVVMHKIESLPISPADPVVFPAYHATLAFTATAPPFKPPRSFLI